jgi:hypothetical protein
VVHKSIKIIPNGFSQTFVIFCIYHASKLYVTLVINFNRCVLTYKLAFLPLQTLSFHVPKILKPMNAMPSNNYDYKIASMSQLNEQKIKISKQPNNLNSVC